MKWKWARIDGLGVVGCGGGEDPVGQGKEQESGQEGAKIGCMGRPQSDTPINQTTTFSLSVTITTELSIFLSSGDVHILVAN